jgi:hypothetical protein
MHLQRIASILKFCFDVLLAVARFVGYPRQP